MKKVFAAVLSLFSVAAVAQYRPVEMPLWPNGAPNSNRLSGEERVPYAHHINNVSVPALSVYIPQNPNGMMVIMCPGGGYGLLSMVFEGHSLADWFCAQGIAYAVLKYRMPNGNWEVPLSDAAQAVRMVRENAAKWKLNPHRVGIMGASAGGHLAAVTATSSDTTARPDFQILLYPVITMLEGTHIGSRNALLGKEAGRDLLEEYSCERRVTAAAPPAFVALSADDKVVNPVNSLDYCAALQRSNVPYSLHVYPTGGHGWGFKDTFKYKNEWTSELKTWLRDGLKFKE